MSRRCEDYPCCGHEEGDCDGARYGTDESVKRAEWDRMMRAEQRGEEW